MLEKWQIHDLVELVRLRFPEWDGFDHPPFVADEIVYKQKSIAKFEAELGEVVYQDLLNQQNYGEIMGRLQALCRHNNLLYNSTPMTGDAGILYAPKLNQAEFCLVMRDLLYGNTDTPQRLQTFANYAQRHGLPNKWAFATYFLFLAHPNNEIFVKPRAAKWVLQFMGDGGVYQSGINAGTYATFRTHAHALRHNLSHLGATSMLDVQSFLWICYRESEKVNAGIKTKAQIDLGIPTSESTDKFYTFTPDTMTIRESEETSYTSFNLIEPAYPLSQMVDDTGQSIETIQSWLNAIKRKKQAIFYGPPGTGKTFIAQAIAKHLISGTDGFSELIQFHPAYSYEDFIEGIRPQPNADGNMQYTMQAGRFLEFCHEAAKRKDSICVLIIDEINRANLARVFGELMYLLEYRQHSIQLAGGTPFSIPNNVRILGTMNTADRSIALVDHALRRRFAFIQLRPNFNGLRGYHERHQTSYPVEPLIKLLQELNNAIDDAHYSVGISYFLCIKLATEIESIWQMEIEPYLEEYFFNQLEKMARFRWQAAVGRL